MWLKRLRSWLTHAVSEAWYAGAWWLCFLLPLSYCFRLIVTLRSWLYRTGMLRSTAVGAPVVVVGNLTVGGTGKTPVVDAIVRLLRDAGYRPGIVCRGYKSHSSRLPVLISPASTPMQVGDEALLHALKTGVPVMVCRDRAAAAQVLVRQEGCDVIVSDDGLQHLSMQRSIELVLFDQARGIGHGHCLPAGPLREPLSRLLNVDKCLLQETHASSHPGRFSLRPTCWRQVISPENALSLDAFKEQVQAPLIGMAGIAHPERFDLALQRQGLKTTFSAFEDHQCYTRQDVAFPAAGAVLMTEKDAVKCRGCADQRHWYLEVEALLPEPFQLWLLAQIAELHHG